MDFVPQNRGFYISTWILKEGGEGSAKKLCQIVAES